MKVEVTGRGIEISSIIREHAEAKLSRLNKHLDDIRDVSVVLSTEKYRQKAEIKFLSKKHVFHGQEETNDMLTSIDRVVEKLDKQARRFKQKLVKEKRKPNDSIKDRVQPELGDTAASDDEPLRVIRVDNVVVKPMSLDEAVDELRKDNNDFIMFKNADSDTMNAVYRRRDGHIGHIEPII